MGRMGSASGIGAVTEGRSSSGGSTANRKAVTQEKILCASMELFAARGFDRTSMSQIAARAGVSRASIFWHFSDKASLFGEACRHFLVPFRESLDSAAAGGNPRERVLQQISAYERFIGEQLEMIHSFVSWIFASQPHAESLRLELIALHRAFVKSLERDLRQLVDDASEAAGLAGTIVSLLHGNMLLSLGGAPPDSQQPRSELLRRLLDRVLPEHQVAGVPDPPPTLAAPEGDGDPGA